MYKDNDFFKLYLSDVGILSSLLSLSSSDILMDNMGEQKGILAENYVANELVKNGFKIYYWQSPEVDFFIKIDENIVPIEVKAAANTQSKALKVYVNKFNPAYCVRISAKNFGYNLESRVKSIPLYATFCIKNNEHEIRSLKELH